HLDAAGWADSRGRRRHGPGHRPRHPGVGALHGRVLPHQLGQGRHHRARRVGALLRGRPAAREPEVTRAGEASWRWHGWPRERSAQYYQKTGKEWEEGGLAACKEADAVLLGAVGWPGVSLPNGDIAGAGVVFGLRFGLDLYANVRPCKLYPGVPHKVSEQFMQVWKPE